ncbi:PRA1 family protein B4-like [Abrus precatorius]|uniref:PRA1 family protein n=1 Tax=Abrus precatorius TaxID=3816 RepID=A0A8B8L553_ABRPR|nr:PRA1 family protein B4-like [Abrus precatorius]
MASTTPSPAPTPPPPVLPITNPNSSEPAAASPAFRAFVSYASESLRHALSQRRAWSELTDRTAFSKPLSFSEATLRIRHNVSYFRINYYVVVSLILAVSLLSNPFSLFMLVALLASWLFLYLLRPSDQPLHLFGRTFSDFETLSLLAALTTFLLFLTSLGSLLVNAVTIAVAVVGAHAALRVPEDLFMDERDASQTIGIFSILRAAVAAPPPVVPR